MGLPLSIKKLTPTKKVPCTICGGDQFRPLCDTWSARVPKTTTPIAICSQCGFVLVNPRWTSDDYQVVMDTWYPAKFSEDPTQRLEFSFDETSDHIRFRKWIRMEQRISPYFPSGIGTLLDIGAGQGWCIDYLKRKHPSVQACFVERWPSCQVHIVNSYGAVHIGSELDEEWDPQFKNSFDLIVTSHILEHVEAPLAALRKIREYLSPTGYAYLAVPGLRTIDTSSSPLVDDFFRPVHLSYFCKESLAALAAQAGLEAEVLEEQNEVWGLFKKSKPQPHFVNGSLFEEMDQRLRSRIKTEHYRRKRFWAKLKSSTVFLCFKLVKKTSQRLLNSFLRMA